MFLKITNLFASFPCYLSALVVRCTMVAIQTDRLADVLHELTKYLHDVRKWGRNCIYIYDHVS